LTDDYVIFCFLFLEILQICTLRMPHISAADKGAWPPGVWHYEADHLGEPDTDEEDEQMNTPESDTELRRRCVALLK
jgi:hypothetical protein